MDLLIKIWHNGVTFSSLFLQGRAIAAKARNGKSFTHQFKQSSNRNCSYFHTVNNDDVLGVFHTSVLILRGLFPKLFRKWRGDSIVPNSWKSPNLSLSVSVVAEIPASRPRLGREPAVTEGSGICPGIASDSAVTTAGRQEVEKRKTNWGGTTKEKAQKLKCVFLYRAHAQAWFTCQQPNVWYKAFFSSLQWVKKAESFMKLNETQISIKSTADGSLRNLTSILLKLNQKPL